MGVICVQSRVMSTGKHIYWYARQSTLEIVDVLCQPVSDQRGKGERLSPDEDMHGDSLWIYVVDWYVW